MVTDAGMAGLLGVPTVRKKVHAWGRALAGGRQNQFEKSRHLQGTEGFFRRFLGRPEEGQFRHCRVVGEKVVKQLLLPRDAKFFPYPDQIFLLWLEIDAAGGLGYQGGRILPAMGDGYLGQSASA